MYFTKRRTSSPLPLPLITRILLPTLLRPLPLRPPSCSGSRADRTLSLSSRNSKSRPPTDREGLSLKQCDFKPKGEECCVSWLQMKLKIYKKKLGPLSVWEPQCLHVPLHLPSPRHSWREGGKHPHWSARKSDAERNQRGPYGWGWAP